MVFVKASRTRRVVLSPIHLSALLYDRTIRPEKINSMLESKGTTGLNQPVKTHTVLSRPQISLYDIMGADEEFSNEVAAITGDRYVIEQAEILVKYSGYIRKEFEMVQELKNKENKKIPLDLDYSKIKSLSTEGYLKLSKIKPETIGQASRISGVSASDVAVLMVYLKG